MRVKGALSLSPATLSASERQLGTLSRSLSLARPPAVIGSGANRAPTGPFVVAHSPTSRRHSPIQWRPSAPPLPVSQDLSWADRSKRPSWISLGLAKADKLDANEAERAPTWTPRRQASRQAAVLPPRDSPTASGCLKKPPGLCGQRVGLGRRVASWTLFAMSCSSMSCFSMSHELAKLSKLAKPAELAA